MTVHFQKNAYDPPEPEADGLRVVATRYWPRGLPKAAADLYLPGLSPSKELLHAFQDGDISWRTFASRYKAEMQGQAAALRTLHWLSQRQPVTVMCVCDPPDRCHRSLLADLIEKAG